MARPVELITSPQNNRVKSVLALREPAERRARQALLIEGFDDLSIAIKNGVRIRQVIQCPDLLKPGQTKDLSGWLEGIDLWQVTPAIMGKLAYRDHPDAWLAIADQPTTELATFLDRSRSVAQGAPPLLVLVEGVEKPGNVGAILRSADAAGAHGLLATSLGTDLGNPNIVRASKGALFALPLATAEPEAVLALLRQAGIAIIAATPEAATPFWQSDLTGPVVFAVGAEKPGLSHFWREAADAKVQIPMRGRVNSLNVAQAATLFLYEAWRQRGGV